MKTKILISLLTVLLMAVFTGCKKEETSTGEVKKPDIAKNGVLISTPEGLKKSNDPMAQTVLSLFQNLNMAGNYLKLFTPPEDATPFNADVNGAAAYTWSDGEATYWLVFYETNDKYIWNLDADFGSGRSQYAHIEETKDQKSGSFEMTVPQQPAVQGTWSYDADGNCSIEINFQGPDGNTRITAIENADGSGELHLFVNGKEKISAQWNADGSGSYIIYNENGGTFTGQWSSGK